ncbi:MAG: preprotein translocase subunit YajC [Phycisphaerae bacterium]|nr:preprotein translocase subunit YajC [Phycisphaerae bacterium]
MILTSLSSTDAPLTQAPTEAFPSSSSFSLSLSAGFVPALAQAAPPLAGEEVAQTARTGEGQSSGAGGGGGPGPTGPTGMGSLTYLMIGFIVLWVVMLMFGQRREGKKKQRMLSGLKKHDRVQTSGGVIGSIVEIKPDIVVLKVDEQSNTRVTFARSAIVGILKESAAETTKDTSSHGKSS